jgi:hypothetical protein
MVYSNFKMFLVVHRVSFTIVIYNNLMIIFKYT